MSSGKDQEEEDEDSDGENLAEADEDESDLDLAWKMLDVARAIVEKHSNDSMEKVDILSALAEVALERGLSSVLVLGISPFYCLFLFESTDFFGGFLSKPPLSLNDGLFLCYAQCRGHRNFSQRLPESTIYLRTAG